MLHFVVNSVIAIILGLSTALGLYVFVNDPEKVPEAFTISYEEARDNLCYFERKKFDLDYNLAPVHQRMIMEAVLISKDEGPKICGFFRLRNIIMSKELPANYELKHPSTYSYKLTYEGVIRMSFYKGTFFHQEVL